MHHIRGPTSFNCLKTFEGQLFATFREAAGKHGLTKDDKHWMKTLEEAAIFKSATRLRDLFVILLKDCALSNPLELWNKFKDEFTDDILNRLQYEHPDIPITYTEEMYHQSLSIIQDKLLQHGSHDLSYFGFPSLPQQNVHSVSRELLQQTSFDSALLEVNISSNEPKLTPDQKNAYHIILQKIQSDAGGASFS